MNTKNIAIVGSQEMSKLIRAFDWKNTSLGPIEVWPQSLITSVNLLLQSPIPMVMLWGKDGIMIYNDAYSEFAAARHPQLLGSKVVEGWPEVADFNRNVMDKGLKGKTLTYKDQQLTLYRNNVAEEVWMDLTYSPIIDESGKPGGVLAIVIENTKRVQAEKKQQEAEASLRAEQERLQSMFMQAPAMIAVLHGPEHVFVLANPFYMQLVGHRPIHGKPVREALPEVVGQGFIKILDKVYTTAKPFYGNELAVDLDDGKGGIRKSYLNFVYQPSYDEHHKVEGILVHAVDVTEQVKSRQQVEEIASLNKSITDNATTGMLIMDNDQLCTFMNPAAEKIMGMTFAEVKKSGKPLHDLAHYKKPDGSPYPIEECPTTQNIPRKGGAPSEDIFVRPDGSMYPVSVMSSPIVQNGATVGTVIEFRDITKEKAAENEIRELNKELEARVQKRTEQLTIANKELERSNEELEDFAYVASHDLQEPLRKIAAFSNLLEEDFKDDLPAEAQAYLSGIHKSSGRMRTLISDLLTYSRVTTQARPFETIDLSQLAHEALEDLQARVDETGAKVVIDALGSIEGDPLQLRLLLQNLVSNALKYTRPGVKPVIHVSSSVKDERLTLKVKDNGIGFDVQYLDRIFTIFQRLHGKNEYEGTGVGLAISKKIIDRHKGTITAKSKQGSGSTFITTLPIHQEAASWNK
ncbi:MAG: chemotaxis protein methyltransferase CheR [Candidatus Saccharibacteria bacterium]|nr:chemotaxis protein methyltransferase CheR [Candidatus Saccharibacteria bacterium]